MILADTISYTLARDEKTLNQYFDLRKKVYMSDFELTDFTDHEDEFDTPEKSLFLVITDKDNVIGGMRITTHKKLSDSILPLEHEGFYLQDVFNEPDILTAAYTEVSRTVLLPEFRDGIVSTEMYRYCYALNKEIDADYLFSVSPAIQARNTRRRCKSIGIDFRIRQDIAVPDRPYYHGKKMYFAYIDMHYNTPGWAVSAPAGRKRIEPSPFSFIGA